MKRFLHGTALRLERWIGRIKVRGSDARMIEPYAGFATAEHLILRGRVLTALRRQSPRPEDGWFSNLRQMISLFLTDEVGDVPLSAGEVAARSDEEGYFTLVLPRPDVAGWVEVEVRIDGYEDRVLCPALVPGADARFMVISDIDDTVLETGAHCLLRNLWTSLTGNIYSRQIYPDAVNLISELSEGGRNPVFYVSSSPWNLYSFLTQLFERNGLVRGPMFLRDLGLSETKFITGGHGSHKRGSIDTLIKANPGLRVILMGDTGQKDAAIYAGVVRANPGRVAAVVLRETADGLNRADRAPIGEIERAGVPVFLGRQLPACAALMARIGQGGTTQAPSGAFVAS